MFLLAALKITILKNCIVVFAAEIRRIHLTQKETVCNFLQPFFQDVFLSMEDTKCILHRKLTEDSGSDYAYNLGCLFLFTIWYKILTAVYTNLLAAIEVFYRLRVYNACVLQPFDFMLFLYYFGNQKPCSN